MKLQNSLNISLSVWKALLLREGVRRFFGSRASWFWLISSPVIQVLFMVMIFVYIRQREVGGMDVALWLVIGILIFNLFRRSVTQGMNAISSNKGLFSYPQVKPIDAIFMRVFLELFITTIVAVVLCVGLLLADKYIFPDHALTIFSAFLAMWLAGVGLALIFSAAVELVDELSQVINFLMLPMYLMSGVIFPIAQIPQPYRDYVLLNPMAHGVEAARAGFSINYHAFPELDLSYLYLFSLIVIFIGLMLQQYFNRHLSAY